MLLITLVHWWSRLRRTPVSAALGRYLSVESRSTLVNASLIEAARTVNLSNHSLQDTLGTIVRAVRRSLPEFDHVGVSVAEPDGAIRTKAASDELVWNLDDLQYSLEEGPCVDAMRGPWPIVALEHADRDDRWPNYLRRARETGLKAQLGLRLCTESETFGGLNLYSTTSSTIAADTPGIAELFASHAAIALARSRREAQLHDAMSTRKVIGQAIGLTMERYGIDEDRAFGFLVRASQTRNVKLRDVAQRIVEGANGQYSGSPRG